jgi:hypothetical protein
MTSLTRGQFTALMSLGFAILAALLLLAGVLLRGQSRESDEVPAKPTAPAPAIPAPEPPDPKGRPSAEPADLLLLLDPAKDAVAGFWTMADGVLTSPKLPFARLQLPYLPPEEYDLAVTAERREGGDSLNLGIVAGRKQAVLVLDGSASGDTTGLDVIGVKWFMDNATTYKGKLLAPGKKSFIAVSVRRSHFHVSVDGKTVIDWKPDYGSLSLFKEWTVWSRRALFVGSFDTSFRIHEFTVTPHGGEGTLLR